MGLHRPRVCLYLLGLSGTIPAVEIWCQVESKKCVRYSIEQMRFCELIVDLSVVHDDVKAREGGPRKGHRASCLQFLSPLPSPR